MDNDDDGPKKPENTMTQKTLGIFIDLAATLRRMQREAIFLIRSVSEYSVAIRDIQRICDEHEDGDLKRREITESINYLNTVLERNEKDAGIAFDEHAHPYVRNDPFSEGDDK